MPTTREDFDLQYGFDVSASLQVIATDKLLIHPQYQRTVDKSRAEYIAKDFNPRRALALGVCPDPDHEGHYLVWDGGHRLHAAVLRGVPYMACVVADDITPQTAGSWFVHQDDGRTRVSVLDKHRVGCNIGEPDAIAIQAIADARGLRFVSPNSKAILGPNECDALSVIYERWKGTGALAVQRTIDTILAAYPTDSDRWSFDFFRALQRFWKTTPDADLKRLARALKAKSRKVAAFSPRSTPVPVMTNQIKVLYYEAGA